MNYPLGEFEETQEEVVNRDAFGEQTSFLQDVATLIAELPALKQATSENYSFTFVVLPLSDPYEFPAALKHIAKDVDDITVHIGDPHIPEENDPTPERPAHLSVDVVAGNAIYTFSRSGLSDADYVDVHRIITKDYKKSEPHDRFTTRETKLGIISKAEINALLMSIALPNSLADYSAYSDKELQSSDAFESLRELLSQKAYAENETQAFYLKDGEADLHYTKEDGQLTSFTITYYDEKRKMPMIIECDIDVEFKLSFFASDEHEKRALIPTADEINYIRTLLEEELKSLSVTRVAYQEETVPDTSHQDRQEQETKHEIASLTETALKEFGLNPPDTSA